MKYQIWRCCYTCS